MGRNIGLTYWCIVCSVEWVPPTAAVWPLSAEQRKRRGRVEPTAGKMDKSVEATQLRVDNTARLARQKDFVATQHALREVHSGATLVSADRKRFSTTTPAPDADRAEGPHGNDPAHMRYESRPEALRAYLARKQQEAVPTQPAAGGSMEGRQNTTRVQASKELAAMRERTLRKFPKVQKQLNERGVQLAPTLHGGSDSASDAMPIKIVRIGNFAVTSLNKGFNDFNALEGQAGFDCDCDGHLWPSYTMKAGRSCGDGIKGYPEYKQEYEKQLVKLVLSWIEPSGGVVMTYSEPAWRLFAGGLLRAVWAIAHCVNCCALLHCTPALGLLRAA